MLQRRTPLRAKTGFKAGGKGLKRGGRLPAMSMSPHRVEARDKERQARAEYQREHPRCEFSPTIGGEPCGKPVQDNHHKAGKIGPLRWDKRYFMSCCREHHMRIETNRAEARALGYLLYGKELK